MSACSRACFEAEVRQASSCCCLEAQTVPEKGSKEEEPCDDEIEHYQACKQAYTRVFDPDCFVHNPNSSCTERAPLATALEVGGAAAGHSIRARGATRHTASQALARARVRAPVHRCQHTVLL